MRRKFSIFLFLARERQRVLGNPNVIVGQNVLCFWLFCKTTNTIFSGIMPLEFGKTMLNGRLG